MRCSLPEGESSGDQLKLEIKAGSTTCTGQVFGLRRRSFFLPLWSLSPLAQFRLGWKQLYDIEETGYH
jgi:hypothetical protein